MLGLKLIHVSERGARLQLWLNYGELDKTVPDFHTPFWKAFSCNTVVRFNSKIPIGNKTVSRKGLWRMKLLAVSKTNDDSELWLIY